MIPYDLLIPSASRPHLLREVLVSLLSSVDQLPERIIVHDDAAFPDRQQETHRLVAELAAVYARDLVWEAHDPPIRHGPALGWLLTQTRQEFCLYSQDDHVVERPLPIRDALWYLHQYPAICQIRFNKRTTQTAKDRPSKKHVAFPGHDGTPRVFTTSQHWMFQTALWRLSRIRPAVDFLLTHDAEPHYRPEAKVNEMFNGQWRDRGFNAATGFPHPEGMDPMSPAWREVVGTYLWGPMGEPAFVRHIGDKEEDWAGLHNRGQMEFRGGQRR